MIRLGLYLLVCFLIACDSSDSSLNVSPKKITKVELLPLNPYQYSFRCEHYLGNCRLDYFFSSRQDWQNEVFRKKLYKEVLQKSDKNIQHFRVYSLYVYERTKQLNEKFDGDFDKLRAVYNINLNLISYTRWSEGKMDIFYLIENGNVVYDVLENEEINPTWEFD